MYCALSFVINDRMNTSRKSKHFLERSMHSTVTHPSGKMVSIEKQKILLWKHCMMKWRKGYKKVI